MDVEKNCVSFSGYGCWILPDLSEDVVIDDEEAVANQLEAACASWLKGFFQVFVQG